MSQGVTGYDPLGKDRWARLESLETRDGHALPPRLKAEIGREIERLELLARQLRQVEAERDALAAPAPEAAASPAALLLRLKGSARRPPRCSGSRACSGASPTGGSSPPTPGWRRRRG